MIPVVIGVLGTVIKELIKGLGDLEIRGRVAIRIIDFSRNFFKETKNDEFMHVSEGKFLGILLYRVPSSSIKCDKYMFNTRNIFGLHILDCTVYVRFKADFLFQAAPSSKRG